MVSELQVAGLQTACLASQYSPQGQEFECRHLSRLPKLGTGLQTNLQLEAVSTKLLKWSLVIS